MRPRGGSREPPGQGWPGRMRVPRKSDSRLVLAKGPSVTMPMRVAWKICAASWLAAGLALAVVCPVRHAAAPVFVLCALMTVVWRLGGPEPPEGRVPGCWVRDAAWAGLTVLAVAAW